MAYIFVLLLFVNKPNQTLYFDKVENNLFIERDNMKNYIFMIVVLHCETYKNLCCIY